MEAHIISMVTRDPQLLIFEYEKSMNISCPPCNTFSPTMKETRQTESDDEQRVTKVEVVGDDPQPGVSWHHPLDNPCYHTTVISCCSGV